MRNLLSGLAVLLLASACVWADGMGGLETVANSDTLSTSYDNAAPQSDPSTVYGGGSQGQSGSTLSSSSSHKRSAGCQVPDAKPVKAHGKLGFIKNHKKMILGAVLAGGGAYMAYTHVAAWGLIGGPWGAAAIGAGAGLLLGLVIIPKILKLFHRHKNND